MADLAPLLTGDPDSRTSRIVGALVDAFADLMTADPAAFRSKFRKMATDPFAFFRGSACLFYADVVELDDPWADERTSRVWIQGDLHAENFGTSMDAEGVLLFDVNDFDEAYLGHFTWDVQRLAASVALLGWRKALPDDEIDALVARCARSYVRTVRRFAESGDRVATALRLENTEGAIREALQRARLRTRVELLDGLTETEGYDRRFRDATGVRRLDDAERERVCAAFERYLDTIPTDKRFRGIAYTVKDVVGRSGFGIGSAGLPAYNVLIEGFNEALDNDVVLSMKQGNVAAPSRVVADERVRRYFSHHGHRTAVSQRALQSHADPLLGYTELDGTGFVVSELSPYTTDLDWSELTEPADIAPVLDGLGRAAAKAHCVSDSDSEATLVPFQTEETIAAAVGGREPEFVDWVLDFARQYAGVVRDDHRLFVDAFRGGAIPGVESTRESTREPRRA